MHDWWLGLIASAFGQVLTEETCPVDYRQHAGNTLGARVFPRVKPVHKLGGGLEAG